MSLSSHNVFGSGRAGTTIEGDVSGSFTTDMGLINNHVYGSINTKTARGSVSQAKTDFQFVGYGPVGTQPPYIGKVADWTQSSDWISGSSAYLGFSKYFTASCTAWSAFPSGSLKYSSGILNISATYS
ncbi:hypothetical protein [Aneurinibacillus terranovensis]|uniref:hypothetical protein n=1 Tax=Aneurinibacillus terranovensis TaxID=278991 RepID=UPI0012DFB033